jgi:hypothetical protein
MLRSAMDPRPEPALGALLSQRERQEMAVPQQTDSDPDEAAREEMRQQLAAEARREADKLPPERVDRDPAVGPLGLQAPIPRSLARLATFLARAHR